ncbi:olfactory receptor 5V1-like [Pleurodeles waltl]|uniref:olfactory receptor 5V1-like n=1 Tax=Pleurodeles waltl TaxID=8319 RepID=UPI003709B1DA
MIHSANGHYLFLGLRISMENETSVNNFIFSGFSHLLRYQGFLFVGFLFIYLLTLMGNILIFTLIWVDTHLHTPMYFFLGNLSVLDICYSSATIPQILHNLLMEKKVISFQACMSQLFFLITCAGAECILLAVMAYDRFVAICAPLRYLAVMSRGRCIQLATCPWAIGILNSALHTVLTSSLSFCDSNVIQHFFCDVPQLLKLSCVDTSLNNTVLHVVTVFVGLSPCLLIIISYFNILSSIMKIRSPEGRWKTFSTCGSHLTVVFLYYGTVNFNYNRPTDGYSVHIDTLASVLFCMVTPMLNPILYSLRNKEVMGALRRTVHRLHLLTEG